MTQERLFNSLKIRRNIEFEIDGDCDRDMLCVICENVLMNAHCGPCGCRYCLDCVSEYLNGEEKMCPGNTDECHEELLDMHINVCVDELMNIQLSRVIVKCPHFNCQFKDEARRIQSHLEKCGSLSTTLMFQNRNISDSNTFSDVKRDEILREVLLQSKSMQESMNDMRNEMNLLKKDLSDLKIENVNLKKEIESMKRDKIIEKKIIDDNRSENVREIRELQKKLEETQNILKEEQIESTKKYEEINEKFIDLKSILTSRNKSISDLENNVRLMKNVKEKFGEFVWRIDKWSHKLEQARAGITKYLYSEAFYSHRNGYKMCLCVDPNGIDEFEGTHLSVFFYLMRGEFDDILSWPFKHDVTFELINQHTTQTHTQYTVKYQIDEEFTDIYQKPINDMNDEGYGHPNLVSLNELSNNLSLIDKDQIIIRCRVKIDADLI